MAKNALIYSGTSMVA